MNTQAPNLKAEIAPELADQTGNSSQPLPSYEALVVGARQADWHLVQDRLMTFACLEIRWTACWTSAESEIFSAPRPPAFLIAHASEIDSNSFAAFSSKLEAFAELAPRTRLVVIADRFVAALDDHLDHRPAAVLSAPCSTEPLAAALIDLMANSDDHCVEPRQGFRAGEVSECSFAELAVDVRPR